MPAIGLTKNHLRYVYDRVNTNRHRRLNCWLFLGSNVEFARSPYKVQSSQTSCRVVSFYSVVE